MGNAGEDVISGFRELRRFCNQLSLFLKTADGLMEEAGWIPVPRLTVVGNGSGDVNYPDWWLPADFSRVYRNKSHKQLLTYVAAIVNDHPDDPGGVMLTESLISAGWIEHDVGTESKPWEYRFCRTHIWWNDQVEFGTLRFSDAPHTIGLPPHVLRLASLAVRLDDVQSAAALSEKIVQPLLKDISQRTSSTVVLE